MGKGIGDNLLHSLSYPIYDGEKDFSIPQGSKSSARVQKFLKKSHSTEIQQEISSRDRRESDSSITSSTLSKSSSESDLIALKKSTLFSVGGLLEHSRSTAELKSLSKKFTNKHLQNLQKASGVFKEYISGINFSKLHRIPSSQLEKLETGIAKINLKDFLASIKRWGDWINLKEFFVFCTDINARIGGSKKNHISEGIIKQFPKKKTLTLSDYEQDSEWKARHKIMEKFLSFREELIKRSLIQAIGEYSKNIGSKGLKIEFLKDISDSKLIYKEISLEEALSLDINTEIRFIFNNESKDLIELSYVSHGSNRITSDLDMNLVCSDADVIKDIIELQENLLVDFLDQDSFTMLDTNVYPMQKDLVEENKNLLIEYQKDEDIRYLDRLETVASFAPMVLTLLENNNLEPNLENIQEIFTKEFNIDDSKVCILEKQLLSEILSLYYELKEEFIANFRIRNHKDPTELESKKIIHQLYLSQLAELQQYSKNISSVEITSSTLLTELSDDEFQIQPINKVDDIDLMVESLKKWKKAEILRGLFANEAYPSRSALKHNVLVMQDKNREIFLSEKELASATISYLGFIVKHAKEGLASNRLTMTLLDISKYWERVSDALLGESTSIDAIDDSSKIISLRSKFLTDNKEEILSSKYIPFINSNVEFRRILNKYKDNPEVWKYLSKQHLKSQYDNFSEFNFSSSPILSGSNYRSIYENMHIKIAKDLIKYLIPFVID